MRRRHFVASLPCMAALPAWAQLPHEAAWRDWKAAYLRGDGRVVDEENEGISHSEGQAYGLLLAQAWGDRAAFEQIEDWTRMNLAKRNDTLPITRDYMIRAEDALRKTARSGTEKTKPVQKQRRRTLSRSDHKS